MITPGRNYINNNIVLIKFHLNSKNIKPYTVFIIDPSIILSAMYYYILLCTSERCIFESPPIINKNNSKTIVKNITFKKNYFVQTIFLLQKVQCFSK